jgi:hypothetical protein
MVRVPIRLAAASIAGRWLGQDKHDYCGAVAPAVKPNGVQDVHIALRGLAPQAEIASAVITGKGSGEWRYGSTPNQFSAAIVRAPGTTTADVYFEPIQVETGREFCVKLTFRDASVVEVYLPGGKADPNLRMPGAAMSAKWMGQEPRDHAGSGPGVGPDGLQDVRIELSRLAPRDRIKSILVEDASGPRWAYGQNPKGYHNAEFVARGAEVSSEGSLYFHPESDLNGHKLTVTVAYQSEKQDKAVVTAGRCDPKLAMPRASLPMLASLALTSRWLGQDGAGASAGAPGDVHVALSGLPAGKAIAAAVLTDPVRGVWVFRPSDRTRLDIEPGAAPLGFRRGVGTGSADLYFSPCRDESNMNLTLRLIFTDGSAGVATIPGGPCDPNRRAAAIRPGEAVARSAEELLALVNNGGTVRLAKGNYQLTKPLVLPRPLAIVGEPGAVLTFAQAASEPPWTTAIKIHSGGTTLSGLAIRFAGPVRWKNDVSWGPAVIGTTDQLDSGPNPPKVNLSFLKLDIEGPPTTRSKTWEEAIKLMRLLNAPCGRIVGNTLRGGPIEFFEGPWTVEDNEFRGTPAGTVSQCVFAAHDPHDLVVKNNRAKWVAGSGKTWRFLLFTTRGFGDRVENNTVEGIGPRDNDTIPPDNAPEIFLTESYHVRFEGKPAAVSDDGRLVKVGGLPGEPPRTGDVVSILSGTGAGQWRRIAQRIEPDVYWLESPLPRGAGTILISPGFVSEVFSGNSVEARGGRDAAGFVLAGNHFGTRVLNNKVVGAGHAFQIMAYPSESPRIWGWSHAPFLGGAFEGNLIEDSEHGALLGVHHGNETKTNKGRVYMTMNVTGNTVHWSAPFLSKLARTPARAPSAGIELGYKGSLDPAECTVAFKDNRLDAPAASPAAGSALKVHAALLNGQAVSEKSYALPAGGATSAGLRAAEPRGGSPR